MTLSLVQELTLLSLVQQGICLQHNTGLGRDTGAPSVATSQKKTVGRSQKDGKEGIKLGKNSSLDFQGRNEGHW